MVIWPWSRRPEDNNCWQKILSRYWECCTFVCFIMRWVFYPTFLNALIRYWHDLAGLPSSAIPRRPTSWGTSHTFSRNYQVVLKFLRLFWSDAILFVFWFANFWNLSCFATSPQHLPVSAFNVAAVFWQVEVELEVLPVESTVQVTSRVEAQRLPLWLCGIPNKVSFVSFCRWCHGHFRSLWIQLFPTHLLTLGQVFATLPFALGHLEASKDVVGKT